MLQIRDMAYYLIILFIVVTSYGVVRQAIHFQNTEVSWPRALRNIWFYPYWMIYGELFAEEIDRKFVWILMGMWRGVYLADAVQVKEK